MHRGYLCFESRDVRPASVCGIGRMQEVELDTWAGFVLEFTEFVEDLCVSLFLSIISSKL
jgi:hypothetical protein